MAADSADFRDGMPFLGGALWLDLLNTTPVIGGQAYDFIANSEKLRRWQALAGLPEAPSDTLETLALREELRPMVDHLTTGLPMPKPVVALVNDHLARTPITRRLDDSQISTRLIDQHAPLSLASAAALDFACFVVDFEPDRLKHCQNPACTMVFYDRGKNNRRRWCSTSACGNRDKVANYRKRLSAKRMRNISAIL
jgi:predicted RNA-binding Zn ribbon-like protein